jgi:hypothetical protein
MNMERLGMGSGPRECQCVGRLSHAKASTRRYDLMTWHIENVNSSLTCDSGSIYNVFGSM